MVLTIIFYASLVCIALLLLTKVREQKTRRSPFLLRVISLGDERMKDLSHRSAHFYADTKEDIVFFLEKQLPIHSKRLWNKAETLAQEKYGEVATKLRGTKLFKKNGNISDYFQTFVDEGKAEESTAPDAASDTEENRVE